jgi:ABC-type multidrug transport system fused ATPase/permease subunit
VRRADCIHLLENGRIVAESSSHDALLARKDS